MKRIVIALALAVGLAAQPALVAGQGAAGAQAPRRSSEQGVTVTVRPLSLALDAKVWEFEIVLDTHSQDLGDNLVEAAVLVDGSGRQYKPTAWDGAGPGGHHRRGVLRFDPISPSPEAIELQIRRPGEARPRVFRWELK